MIQSPVLPDELRRVYLFASLDAAQFAQVQRSARLRRLAADEELFRQRQPVEHFFLLTSGQIKLFRLSADGGEKVIEIIRPGQTFAEAAMFMERDLGYPVNAAAIEPSEVWVFERKVFMDILRHSVDACFGLMATMSARLHRQLNDIDRLTLHNATYRLVSYLMQEADENSGGNERVHLTTPKNIIASRLSIQPETFSRILSNLARRGLIEVEGQSIVLRDRVALARIAELPAE
jgi:CRP-like cAMP-binding protein